MSAYNEQTYFTHRFNKRLNRFNDRLYYKVRTALCETFAAENGWNEISDGHRRLVDDFLTKRDVAPSCFNNNFFEFAAFFNGIRHTHSIFEHAAQLERAPLEQSINERFLELAATITSLQRTIVDLQNDVKMLTLKVAGGEKKE